MDGAEDPEKTPVFWLICLRISGWLLFLCAVIIGLAAGIPIIKRNALNGWLIICMAVMIGLAALAVMQVLPHMAADMRKHSFDLGKQKKRG